MAQEVERGERGRYLWVRTAAAAATTPAATAAAATAAAAAAATATTAHDHPPRRRSTRVAPTPIRARSASQERGLCGSARPVQRTAVSGGGEQRWRPGDVVRRSLMAMATTAMAVAVVAAHADGGRGAGEPAGGSFAAISRTRVLRARGVAGRAGRRHARGCRQTRQLARRKELGNVAWRHTHGGRFDRASRDPVDLREKNLLKEGPTTCMYEHMYKRLAPPARAGATILSRGAWAERGAYEVPTIGTRLGRRRAARARHLGRHRGRRLPTRNDWRPRLRDEPNRPAKSALSPSVDDGDASGRRGAQLRQRGRRRGRGVSARAWPRHARGCGGGCGRSAAGSGQRARWRRVYWRPLLVAAAAEHAGGGRTWWWRRSIVGETGVVAAAGVVAGMAAES